MLWSIVFMLGVGLFFPVEQELIRLLAARKELGEGIIPVVRRATMLAAAILAATLVPLALFARPLANRLFGGDIAMVAALAAAFLALAVISVSRGVLAGMGRFKAYGSSLAIDGGLRVVLACVLGVAGVRSPTAFGLILTVAPVLAAACTLGPVLRDLHPGPPVTWAMMCRGLGLLIGTMLLAQLVVNVAVINVRLLSPSDNAVVVALLAAMVLARVPLFVFISLQASLLPGLAGAIAAGDLARFRQMLARGCAVVTILGLAGGLPAVLLGPWLVRVLFAARPVLGYAGLRLARGRDAVLHARDGPGPGRDGTVPPPRPVPRVGSGRRGPGRHHPVAGRGQGPGRGRLRGQLVDRGPRPGPRPAPAHARAARAGRRRIRPDGAGRELHGETR